MNKTYNKFKENVIRELCTNINHPTNIYWTT